MPPPRWRGTAWRSSATTRPPWPKDRIGLPHSGHRASMATTEVVAIETSSAPDPCGACTIALHLIGREAPGKGSASGVPHHRLTPGDDLRRGAHHRNPLENGVDARRAALLKWLGHP